uniref:Plant heme peroxidase family profile domain-containing protein n=1 Tax=Setaria italica TaxID=4555 RepID=K3ZFA9_SETIT
MADTPGEKLGALARVRAYVLVLVVALRVCTATGDAYGGGGLSLERVVKESLSPVFAVDPTSPAALLSLLFHDCQVHVWDRSFHTCINVGGHTLGGSHCINVNTGRERRDEGYEATLHLKEN